MLPAALVLALALIAPSNAADRDVLVDLYKATGGTNWTTNTGWGSSSDMCTWFGVQCVKDGYGTHVESISLSGNNLKGPIVPALGDLKYLRTLDLSSNSLEAGLPDIFTRLNKLQFLRLNNNALSGGLPPVFQNFSAPYPNLQEIQLQYNKLTGAIPETMFGPSTEPPFAPKHALKVLNLRYNGLTGPIPTRLVREQVLVSFLVGGDALSGAVDPDVGKLLNQIKYCDMSGAVYECPLPAGLEAHCQAVCK